MIIVRTVYSYSGKGSIEPTLRWAMFYFQENWEEDAEEKPASESDSEEEEESEHDNELENDEDDESDEESWMYKFIQTDHPL